jgi:hypothetical protein
MVEEIISKRLEELKKIIKSHYHNDEEYKNAIRERQRLYYIRNREIIKEKARKYYHQRKAGRLTTDTS